MPKESKMKSKNKTGKIHKNETEKGNGKRKWKKETEKGNGKRKLEKEMGKGNGKKVILQPEIRSNNMYFALNEKFLHVFCCSWFVCPFFCPQHNLQSTMARATSKDKLSLQ
jgi:hypothetical protein